ncbi:MAG: hypothetical protein IIZ06_07875, partial [Kiritimatiellae bacterium]|nr:hypothetical protein [Kiritimatiellia bacterium]
GLFVEMLRKVVAMSGTTAAENQGGEIKVETLSPTRVLDGQGAFRSPPATAQPVARNFTGRATLAHPPGIYGPTDGAMAVNTLAPADTLAALDLAALGAPMLPIDQPVARDIRPQLLVLALLLLVVDTLATLWLGGRMNLARFRRAAPAALLLAVALATLPGPDTAQAQQPAPPAPPADQRPPVPRDLVTAASATRLAYVLTGDKTVDDMSKAGMAGLNIVLGDEGAAIFLQDKNGTTFAVIVDEVISKQLIKAHTAELLPAGDYKLVVKSRAGDEAGPLQTAFRKVKYLRVVDPVTTRVDNVTNSSIPGDDTIASMSTLTIVGAGLALGEGDEVTVDCMCEGESHHVVFGADAADENTDTRLVLDPEKATGDDLMCDSGTDATVTVKGVAHAVTVGGE